ncbi:YdeI/OmpD-associated family protein [Vallicoccus soli]|uniref:DUF1905 domain-containing protein n=1 Tax=Vallicoccus soli TaxID=2339232 RepID=A0A3A3YWR9_9ACTN|nr:YdeI/OmpD-associated family protein [Vallicoccus soli]RJK96007.1 hypothetical protein D5H78_10580 [Vallicoccus soli]
MGQGDAVPGTGGGWAGFDAVLAPLAWGRSVYTVVRLPGDLVEAARREGTHRLEGHVEAQPVNVGIARADVLPGAFFYVGRPLLRRLEARPGDLVRCRLRPVDPDVVPVPEDVREALAAAGAGAALAALPAARQRRLLVPVESAATGATRARRIEALVRELR